MTSSSNPFDPWLSFWTQASNAAVQAWGAWLDTWRQAVAQVPPPDVFDEEQRARWTKLTQSALDDYRRDLEHLPAAAFQIDYAPLRSAWERHVTGTGTPADQSIVDRWQRAVETKQRFGAEYYAAPGDVPEGATPRELVHAAGKARLYRYTPPAGITPASAPPVALVYSVINRSYILDLMEGFSFVQFLLGRGLDVYMVEWEPAQPRDPATFDEYVDTGLLQCVDHIRASTGAARVSLLGHCIGGVFTACFAALYPERVDRLLQLTVPMTRASGGLVALWTDPLLFPVDRVVDAHGCMPGKVIRYTFTGLKPYLEFFKWKLFVENLGNDAAMALFSRADRWSNDNVDVPGAVFKTFISEVYQHDRLRRGETIVAGRAVRLDEIRCPLLTVTAERDWIVPPESARLLNDLVSSSHRDAFELPGCQHVSLLVDPRQAAHWPRLADFFVQPFAEGTVGNANGSRGGARRRRAKTGQGRAG